MKTCIIIALLIASLAIGVATEFTFADNEPVGTAFTYQGRLKKAGQPANQPVDLTFRLYTVEQGGVSIATAIAPNFSDFDPQGHFTVDIDFGPGVFNGGDRWLEVQVNETILTPRQPLLPTPHAMVAGTAVNVPTKAIAGTYSGITGVGTLNQLNVSGKVGVGTLSPGARLHVADASSLDTGGSGTAIFGEYTNPAGFPGIGVLGITASGASTSAAVAGSATSPTGATRGVHGNVDSPEGYAAYFTGPLGSRNYFQRSVGIGTNAPEAPLHVVEGSDGFGVILPALRIFQNEISHNVVAGYIGNFIAPDIVGATISGGGAAGALNFAGADWATVGGGRVNSAASDGSTVAGGRGNAASGIHSTIGGGILNHAAGGRATVSGGWGNWADGDFATIGGGTSNTAGYAATIGGGESNEATFVYATVGGGRNNTAHSAATVGGGDANVASRSYATVGGGWENVAEGVYATVGGGYVNRAAEAGTTVGGGFSNLAAVQGATVGGGYVNDASGKFATVPGGMFNTAAGDYSFAAGRRAKANHTGAFVLADSTDADFASLATNRLRARFSNGYWLYTNSGASLGVSASANATAWSSISDRNVKHNFTPVDPVAVLDRLASIPIARWTYIDDANSVPHMGPTAQDFFEAFGLGDSDTHISTLDADGVLFAAVQGAYLLVQERDAEIAELRDRIEALERVVHSLIAPSGRSQE